MDIDDFGRGVVAALLTDQVRDKAGLAAKAGWVVLFVSVLITVMADSWVRWLVLLVAVLAAAFLLFVYVTKRFANATIRRIAPPMDIASARSQFDTAVAEADLPTGPLSFLRMMWRLRNGVGPEIDRLGVVVNRLRADLD